MSFNHLAISLQSSQGSYAVDMESPLYRAKLKLQDATSVSPSDPTACYHMGRLCLLLGEKESAQQYLTAALALKPTLSPARLCLGLSLPPAMEKHSKGLLLHGLSQYLLQLQELHETHAEPETVSAKELHSQCFYRSTNALLVCKSVVQCHIGCLYLHTYYNYHAHGTGIHA